MNQVPFIRSGVGVNPNDGGCIMQIIDWISTSGWTDQPECVHPVIRELAIYINDKSNDQERQRLLDLTSRMMGTNTGDHRLARQLLGYLAKEVYPIYAKWKDESGYNDNGAVLACNNSALDGKAANFALAADAIRASRVALAVGAVGAALTADAVKASRVAQSALTADAADRKSARQLGIPTPYDLLVGVIDEYDRLTGRISKPVVGVDYSAVCAVMGQKPQ